MHPGRFPHAVPLTAFHMVVSFILSAVGYACFGKYAYPGKDIVKENPRDFMRKLAPLSILFAVSICCSNQAYIYCSVPFLQMCKEWTSSKRTHGISCGSWHLCLFSSRSPFVVRTRLISIVLFRSSRCAKR